jgi:hypothetical protein
MRKPLTSAVGIIAKLFAPVKGMREIFIGKRLLKKLTS